MRSRERSFKPDTDISALTDDQYWSVVEDFLHSNSVDCCLWEDRVHVGYDGGDGDDAFFDLRTMTKEFIDLFSDDSKKDDRDRGDHALYLLTAAQGMKECYHMLMAAAVKRTEDERRDDAARFPESHPATVQRKPTKTASHADGRSPQT